MKALKGFIYQEESAAEEPLSIYELARRATEKLVVSGGVIGNRTEKAVLSKIKLIYAVRRLLGEGQ